jgi:arsenate reductase
MLTMYHNPRCTKSRETLALLEKSGQVFEVVPYLETPPPANVLELALAALGREVLLRKGEEAHKMYFAGKALSDDEVVLLLLAHPIVLERPLVTDGKRFVLGRPPENVKALL